MKERQPMIQSLHERIARIIADNRQLHGEVRKIIVERDNALAAQREAEATIRTLTHRIEVLETGAGFMGSQADRRVARLRVNKLLREVDRCLALMNK
ncbi:MAG: hypothetical protein PHV49_01870 [Alistipes sp.]|nr:hypothetical protein [Alistipes sp.]